MNPDPKSLTQRVAAKGIFVQQTSIEKQQDLMNLLGEDSAVQ